MSTTKSQIDDLARREGFDVVGITSVEPPPDAHRFAAWLAAGMHGEMRYLERYAPRIADPSAVLPRARSVICLGVNHSRPPGGFKGGGRVARYALGRDYHHTVNSMLRRFTKNLSAAGIGTIYKTIVDAGPALERSLAARAGIGFLSKSANLLHHKLGPWFFLAEVFIDIDCEDNYQKAPGSCGTCALCIERCPTNAIIAPGTVDARRCISYLTIEYKGSIPEALRPLMGDWVFGCDVCSEVCPFGDGAPDASARFGTHHALELSLEDLLRLDEASFARHFAGSPIRRAKRHGMARNAAIALGNLKRKSAANLLATTAVSDPSPVVREACAWAIQQL